MPVLKMCKEGCGRSVVAWNSIETRCPKCIQARSKAKPPQPLKRSTKPIRKQGKHAKLWTAFRDQVARPYLDKKYGHICSVKGCTAIEDLDVDHIKGRGSNPQLRYDVKNMQYLCRPHHQLKTDGKL